MQKNVDTKKLLMEYIEQPKFPQKGLSNNFVQKNFLKKIDHQNKDTTKLNF